eukprot:GHVS01063128.1.p1 GENE.GHVS01063128.1~~GHVS01063128.1.p1  ORF type:complete len:282 (+),score=61.10 GHVS01063128.1:168-1013(+)
MKGTSGVFFLLSFLGVVRQLAMCYESPRMQPLEVLLKGGSAKKKHGGQFGLSYPQELYHRMNKQMAHSASHHAEENHGDHHHSHDNHDHHEDHDNHDRHHHNHLSSSTSDSSDDGGSWKKQAKKPLSEAARGHKGGNRKKDRAKVAALQIEQILEATVKMQNELKQQKAMQQLLVQHVKNSPRPSKKHSHTHMHMSAPPSPPPVHAHHHHESKVVSLPSDDKGHKTMDWRKVGGGKMLPGGGKMAGGAGIFDGWKEGLFDGGYTPVDHSSYYGSIGDYANR